MTRTVLLVPLLALAFACHGGPPVDQAPSNPEAPSADGSSSPSAPLVGGGARGGSASAGGGANVCVGVAASPSCEPALDVATADEVYDQIAGVAESANGSTHVDSGTSLRPSRDLHATADIDLDVTAYRTAHPACTSTPDGGRPSCVETAFFSERNVACWANSEVLPPLSTLPAGVTCTQSEEYGGCLVLHVAMGTIVRFARSLTIHGMLGSVQHVVNVTRACDTPCNSDERRCEASTTCIAATSFCALCEGQPLTVCACRDACSAKAEGAQCYYDESDDVEQSGTCKSGTCKPAP